MKFLLTEIFRQKHHADGVDEQGGDLRDHHVNVPTADVSNGALAA